MTDKDYPKTDQVPSQEEEEAATEDDDVLEYDEPTTEEPAP